MASAGMTEKHCEALAKCKVQFVKDLNPDEVLGHLIETRIITPGDQEDIRAQKTRSDKVHFILDLLPQRSDKAFDSLKKALKDAGSGHHHLNELLDKTLLDDISRPSSAQATDGAVPPMEHAHPVLVTESQLATLAENIFEKWELLASKLGISSNLIYRFKSENPTNLSTQIFSMLVTWRNREYRNATIGVLIQKCIEAGIGRESYEFLIDPQ